VIKQFTQPRSDAGPRASEAVTGVISTGLGLLSVGVALLAWLIPFSGENPAPKPTGPIHVATSIPPSATIDEPLALSNAHVISGRVEVRNATLLGASYREGIAIECGGSRPGSVEWNTAGFGFFEAEIGIEDSSSPAPGASRVVFRDSSGRQLTSLLSKTGQSSRVIASINGAARIAVSCESPSETAWVILGNPRLVR
jgi:hypothetical protein